MISSAEVQDGGSSSLIVWTLCYSLLWFLPGVGSEIKISSLLHIRIMVYIKCHSLREFLMHAQVVYNAALFQIIGFQSFREKAVTCNTIEE